MSARLRLRRFLLTQGRAVVVLLAVLGLLLVVFGGYVYATPPTETVTERVDAQTVSTTVVPSARVTGNTTLYDRGERLVDPSAFLFAATPTVDLAVETTVPGGTAVAADQRLSLVLSAANGGEVFWSQRTLLGARQQRVTDGEAGLTTSLDAREVRERVESTRAELGDVGVFQTRLELVVAYDTQQYQGELEVSAPVVMTDSAYWFSGSLADSRSHSREVTRTVEGTPDLGLVAVLELLGLGLLGAAGSLTRYRGGEADEVAIETELAHSRNEEWISAGEFPTQTDKRFVHINTLEDLVDVAIDSNKRVVHDQDIGAYAVADGDLVYYFAPDRGDIDSWLDV
jgi:hypothetical protein